MLKTLCMKSCLCWKINVHHASPCRKWMYNMHYHVGKWMYDMYCHVGKCMFGMCRHVGKCMYFMCRHVGKSMFNTSAMSEKVCTSCVTMSEKVCSTLLPCQTINFRQIRHVGNEFTTDVLHIRLIKISPQTYHGLHFSLSPCTYVGAKSR